MDKNNINAEVIVKSVISLLKKNGKEKLLPEIIELFKKELDLGDVVMVISPIELNRNQKEKAINFVANLVKEKHVVEFEINKSLIDGMQIRYKDKLWDLSLKKQVNSLMGDIS
jgi:F0F1-type ATP synthase delta subunit